MRLVIDIPDDQVAEFARLLARHLADIGQVPSGGPDRPRPPAGQVAGTGHPPNIRPAPAERSDGPPTDGRTLLGWADRHGLRSQVLRFGRARKYPSKVLEWDPEQVADCYHELSSKPPKGSQGWSGMAGSGRAAPK